MKKVISNDELKYKMKEAINILCNTVKTTLGPKGSNIIIDHSTFSPFITNDGVTIAKNIESEDEIINTILEIAKEASINTNEKVGDGTTTTLVLLQSIFNNGLKEIEKGKNPIILKRELDEHINYIINYIESKKIKPKENDLYNIATISSNSTELGKLITNAFLKVKDINAIAIKESDTEETKIKYIKGYTIDTLIPSLYFFKDLNEIILNNPYVFVINNYLNDIEEISNIINYIIKNNNQILIIAEDYSDIFINQVLSLFLNENVKIYLLKTPEYGKNKIDILNDISLITESKLIEEINNVSQTVLGRTKTIKINKENTTFHIDKNNEIKNKLKELKKIKLKNDIDINFLQKRISMLQKGIIEVLIGASTKIEKREKIMRCEDALYALNSSQNGIVSGSGITLYELSEKLPILNESSNILKIALKEPFNQIMYNSGLNTEKIIKEIQKENYNIIYNVNINDYENITDTEVLDPKDVVTKSLINAISVAGMLLTTTSLIINEYQNSSNKINIFNEL